MFCILRSFNYRPKYLQAWFFKPKDVYLFFHCFITQEIFSSRKGLVLWKSTLWLCPEELHKFHAPNYAINRDLINCTRIGLIQILTYSNRAKSFTLFISIPSPKFSWTPENAFELVSQWSAKDRGKVWLLKRKIVGSAAEETGIAC